MMFNQRGTHSPAYLRSSPSTLAEQDVCSGDSLSGAVVAIDNGGADAWQPTSRSVAAEPRSAAELLQYALSLPSDARQLAMMGLRDPRADRALTRESSEGPPPYMLQQQQLQSRGKTASKLSDAQRYLIIKGVESGEKQATMARRFNVTRAAVCNLMKKSPVIVKRYNEILTQAREMLTTEELANIIRKDVPVKLVRSIAAIKLLTALRSHNIDAQGFHRATNRVINLILEEALEHVPFQYEGMEDRVKDPGEGLGSDRMPCGISIGTHGLPFLLQFHKLDPTAPSGILDVCSSVDSYGRHYWDVRHIGLPSDIRFHRVMLFITISNTGNSVYEAIEGLRSMGVAEKNIRVMAIMANAAAVALICSNFPGVKIVTTAIDEMIEQHMRTRMAELEDSAARSCGMIGGY